MEKELKISAIIGVDPGASGGIAVYIPDGQIVKTLKMPKDLSELRDFFAYYAENYCPLVFLEKLSVRPDDINVSEGTANMGKLYRVQKMMANYEHLKALVETSGIPYCLCHPMTWQTKLRLRIRGAKEDKAERKRRYQSAAARNYPGIKVTLWNADALMIMHFGRWALMNDRDWVLQQIPKREYNKLF